MKPWREQKQGHSRQHDSSLGGLNSLESSEKFRNTHLAKTKEVQRGGDSRTKSEARVFVWIQNLPCGLKKVLKSLKMTNTMTRKVRYKII